MPVGNGAVPLGASVVPLIKPVVETFDRTVVEIGMVPFANVDVVTIADAGVLVENNTVVLAALLVNGTDDVVRWSVVLAG